MNRGTIITEKSIGNWEPIFRPSMEWMWFYR